MQKCATRKIVISFVLLGWKMTPYSQACSQLRLLQTCINSAVMLRFDNHKNKRVHRDLRKISSNAPSRRDATCFLCNKVRLPINNDLIGNTHTETDANNFPTRNKNFYMYVESHDIFSMHVKILVTT